MTKSVRTEKSNGALFEAINIKTNLWDGTTNTITVAPWLSEPQLTERSIIRIEFGAKELYSLSININNRTHMMLICFVLICLIFARSKSRPFER